MLLGACQGAFTHSSPVLAVVEGFTSLPTRRLQQQVTVLLVPCHDGLPQKRQKWR
jgi:hypothetical protein